MRIRKLLISAAALVGVALASQSARAATLQVGIWNSVGGIGAVSNQGSVTGFPGFLPISYLMQNGFSVTGSANGVDSGGFPSGTSGLELSAFTISASQAGTVNIIVNESGLTAPTGLGTLSQAITELSVTPGASLTFALTSFGDNTNSTSLTTPVGTATPVVTSFVAPNNQSSVGFTATSPYSLYEELSITFSGAGTVSLGTSSDTMFAVPLPATASTGLSLFAGLGALVGLRKLTSRRSVA